MNARCLLSALIVVFALSILTPTNATAQPQTVIYNSIPAPLPGHVASIDTVGLAGFGDGLNLVAVNSKSTLGEVKVILDSWACQSGNWGGNCVSKPGATFSVPITISIYGVTYGNGDVPTATLSPLATITKTFAIPYRPSSTPQLCPSNTAEWYDAKERSCYNGLAVPIDIDFSKDRISIPVNSRIVVMVSYNATFYGPNPIGTGTACYATTAGCPYDSLNVSADGNGPTGLANGVGAFLDWNGVFMDFTTNAATVANSCNGSGPGNVSSNVSVYGSPVLNTLADSLCWSGYHPQIEVFANVGR